MAPNRLAIAPSSLFCVTCRYVIDLLCELIGRSRRSRAPVSGIVDPTKGRDSPFTPRYDPSLLSRPSAGAMWHIRLSAEFICMPEIRIQMHSCAAPVKRLL